jgi:DNA-binding protein HU-beta
VNRSQLVKAVAAHTGQEPRAVDATLKGLTDVIMGVASKGEPVAISGFAKFARVDTKARVGRNPATGAPVKIPAKKKARITPLKGFKDAVLVPSQAPKLAKGVWPPAPAAPARKAPAKAVGARTAAKKAAPARATAKKAPAKAAGTRKR